VETIKVAKETLAEQAKGFEHASKTAETASKGEIAAPKPSSTQVGFLNGCKTQCVATRGKTIDEAMQ
jgi:hypothetical protein